MMGAGRLAVSLEPQVEPTDEAQSAAILTAAGFEVYSLSRPVGVFQLLAVCPWGDMLVHVTRSAWPEPLGLGWGVPSGWPPLARRLIHRWADGESLPACRAL